jgi:hypothetical protein
MRIKKRATERCAINRKRLLARSSDRALLIGKKEIKTAWSPKNISL